jgi:hypothetical protein
VNPADMTQNERNRLPLEERMAANRAASYAASARYEAAPLGTFTGHIAGSSTYDYDLHQHVNIDTANVRLVRLSATFATVEERDAYIAARPKMLRLKAATLHSDGGKRPIVTFDVSFIADGVTGSANETGMKRLRRFLELCECYRDQVDNAFIVANCTVDEARRFVGL